MFIQNQILENSYQILRPLGQGGTSSVYLAYHLRLQKYVVIKQIHGGMADPAIFRREADILKNLHHQGLPQVYDYIHEGDQVFTIIDFVDGYDLESYIKSGTKLSEPVLKYYLRQIAVVLDYLHTNSTPVIHSDIKPGNIIIDRDGNAILIDFNTSIGANQGNLLGLTLPYASPEQIRMAQYVSCYQQPDFQLDSRSDLYSLGATFYEVISGIQPTPGVPPVPLQSMFLPDFSKEFLVLIDRLMDYDRERRIQSARKLIITLDRMDGHYWSYIAARCVSILVSVALIAGGLFCMIRGGKQQKTETFFNTYQMASSYVANGALTNAEQIYNQIFEDPEMRNYLQDKPEEMARLYHLRGEISYYREEYALAASYYSYALNAIGSANAEDRSVYLRDAAVAYAESGDLNTARTYLEAAKAESVSVLDLQLMEISIDARSGNLEQCTAVATRFLQECPDQDLCFRAAMTVANASKDPEHRIHWLTLARQYASNRSVLRSLAAAYTDKALAPDASNTKKFMQEAADYYAQLCAQEYPSTGDMINYSVVLRHLDRDREARDVLQNALEDAPGNFRVLLELCSVCYDLEQTTSARKYCQQARDAWKTDTSASRPSETSNEIEMLKELAKRLNVGGI